MGVAKKLAVLFILSAIELMLIFYIILSSPADTETETSLSPEETKQEAEKILFSPSSLTNGLSWDHLPITYRIDIVCGDYETNQLRSAFKSIEDSTFGVISFMPVEDNEDISITCSFIEDCYEKKNSADGGEILKTEEICAHSLGRTQIRASTNRITKAEITMFGLDGFAETDGEGFSGFSIGDCGKPDAEIHEILHAFGYGHFDDEKSIMNAQTETVGYTIRKEGECNEIYKSIDSVIVKDLIDTYSQPSITGRIIDDLKGNKLSVIGIFTILTILIVVILYLFFNRMKRRK